ncbi:MAG: polyribonucleotide nucleotidyltransferase [Fimbriimonadaceae bacterium]|nr:polyribonucleotide nucleotidyltransferase [Fimbriimonadaceae bacterium]
MIHTHTFEVGGKTLSIESGRVAKQAGGAVLLGMGETVVLATATMSKNPRVGLDFFPLTCDFEERKYAVGKIPGGFQKRGGRPTDKSILSSRLMDRPLRPLFPEGMRNDVQIIATTFSVDFDCPPDVLAITAAGAALAVSDIPFNGPVAGVRVGCIDGEFILYPSFEEIERSELDLCVAGHKGAISMVEAGAKEVSEELMTKALQFAHKAIQQICKELEIFAKEAGKAKRDIPLNIIDKKLIESIKKSHEKDIAAALSNADKMSRESALDELTAEITAGLKAKHADEPEILAQLNEAVDKVVKATVRKLIIEKDQRPDGRKLDQIRNLEAIPGILPKVHGSGLFTRGQTQVMTVATLGTPGDSQTLDGLDPATSKRYMHFYNFPPYSVGEARPMRGPGRREIGHGALAERALVPVIPMEDPDFPYTILLISECLESNGSTSMASVCGSTLALLDAGVPIKAPVAGIAMGLMSDGKTFKVLTDIQGMEDFCGDMDFKVAGTRDGITALQLDTKLDGIPEKVLSDALKQALKARMQILDVIDEAMPARRTEINPNAPRITTIQINPEKIGALIGPGGATIRKLTAETGCQIDVQQDGRVLVASNEGHLAEAAIEQIRALTASLEVGMEFSGAITRLMGKGALVEMPGGKDGLVPTELLAVPAPGRPDDVVSVGDKLNVRVYEVDAQGRVNLTALGVAQEIPALAGNANADPNTRPTRSSEGRDRGGRGGFGGRDRDRGGRGGYGDRDRGGRDRGDRGDRGYQREDRDQGESNDAPVKATVEMRPARGKKSADASDGFPKKSSGEGEEGNAKFRPRR